MDTTLKIKGMMCQHCVKHVTEALSNVDGVTAVKVDLAGEKADLATNKPIDEETYKKAIVDAGYELVAVEKHEAPQRAGKNVTLHIEGMMCQHCVKHVTEALSKMDGVTAVNVDLEGKKADVTESRDIPRDEFAKVIKDAGYELVK